MSSLIPQESIENKIYLIHGHKVMLDMDLARLYGVQTKVLNQAVKRNKSRFPKDFMFQLASSEKMKLVTDCDRIHDTIKYSNHLPYAFTEHGTLMLANVLHSDRAIRVSLEIIRTFMRLREMLSTHKHLAQKLTELESRYDAHFKSVFAAIRELMAPPARPRREIGFNRSS